MAASVYMYTHLPSDDEIDAEGLAVSKKRPRVCIYLCSAAVQSVVTCWFNCLSGFAGQGFRRGLDWISRLQLKWLVGEDLFLWAFDMEY